MKRTMHRATRTHTGTGSGARAVSASLNTHTTAYATTAAELAIRGKRLVMVTRNVKSTRGIWCMVSEVFNMDCVEYMRTLRDRRVLFSQGQ